MLKSVTLPTTGRRALTRSIRAALGVALAVPALPALSLDTLPAQQTETAVAAFAEDYGHLSGRELAATVLTRSGKIAIDPQTDTLYAVSADTHLAGRSFTELAALVWGIPEAQLSSTQLYATYRAMEALQLDSRYPYSTEAQVQATVLKRIAQSADQQQLLAQYGIGSAAYLSGDDSVDVAVLVQELFTHMAQQQGMPEHPRLDLTNRMVDLTRNADSAMPEILIYASDVVLRGQTFDPKAGVIAVDAEDGDLTGKLQVQGHVDTDRVGRYELKYSVTDSQGLHSEAQRTITVTQNESSRPRINGAGPKLIYTGQDFDPLAGVSAWDEEDGDLTDKITVSGSVDSNKAAVYLVNYSVMDSDGHSHRLNRMVLVENLRAKSIDFKGLRPAILDLYQAFDPMAGVTAIDETDGDITGRIRITNPVDTSKGGIYRVRYQVSNSQGAQKTRFKTVIVRNSLPQLTLDGWTTLELGQAFDPMAGVSAQDREDGVLTERITISGAVDPHIPGIYTLTYRVTDNNGGLAERVRQVRVSNITSADNALPTINVERQTRIPVDGGFEPMAGVSAADAEDGDLTASIRVSGAVDTATPGYQQLIYSVVDSAGSVASVERTVHVYNQVPVIIGARSTVLPLNAPFNPMTGVTASDGEDGDLTSAVSVTGSVDTGIGGVYSLLYKVTDRHGGEGFALRAVVVENSVPQIHGLEPVTIGHDQPFNPLAGVTASDAEDGDLTGRIRVSDNLDISQPGAYVLTYTVKDSGGAVATGMRAVVVQNTVPEIHGIKPVTITAGDPFDPFAGITAVDAEDGDLTAALQVQGQFDRDKAGIYTLHYLVRDSKGAEARRGRSVMVKAAYNNAPQIHGVNAITVGVGQAFEPLTGISASDEEDGDLSAAISVSGSVDTTRAGRYRLTYRVTDSGGKRDTAYRTVTVTNAAPEFSGLERASVPYGGDFDPLAGVSATDEEDGDLTGKITVSGTVNTERAGNYRLKYSVSDSNGKSTTKTRTVNVKSRFSR